MSLFNTNVVENSIQYLMSKSVADSIFILAGQSNMAGRGGVVATHHHHEKHWDGVVPPECAPHKSILRLSADMEWETACEPLHHDIDKKKVCGVGPGMSFANSVRERMEIEAIRLVPCAVGGTAIHEWRRAAPLYENMVARAKEAAKCGGTIEALLWYQGESDTSSSNDAHSYRSKMEQFIHHVRQDLALPSLPIIQVAVASGDGRYIDVVRQAQLEIDLPSVVCVDAKGLTLKDDHLHLTTRSQVLLGHMLADVYISHFTSPAKITE